MAKTNNMTSIVYKDLLHPTGHGTKLCCQYDKGNGYTSGETEPWGAIPVRGNVKGALTIRQSFLQVLHGKHEKIPSQGWLAAVESEV